MSRKNLVLVLVAMLVLAVSSLACGGSPAKGVAAEIPVETGVEEVDEAVEELVEGVTDGTPCEFTWISQDVQVRLAHYRICVPEKGKEQKRVDALQDALEDCFKICNETFGVESEEGISCTTQCKGE